MSPSVTCDFKENERGDHVWDVEVPVYFLTTSGTTNPTGAYHSAGARTQKK
jgi:hypothetical protein